METANIPRATDLRNEAINALAGRLKTQLYDENAQSWEAEIASAKDVLDGAVAAGDEDAAKLCMVSAQRRHGSSCLHSRYRAS